MPDSIALATCAHHPGFVANDDAPVQAAFERRDIAAPLLRWDDPDIDWSSFDAVIIRTTWDYTERPREFLAWCDRVGERVRLINPPDLVRWNLDKIYLRDLERAGLPIVPTRWLEPAGERSLDAALAATDWREIICKPSVGAGASGLLRARYDKPHAEEADRVRTHCDALLARGPVLVQPWLPSILDRGETSVVIFEGEVSHAVRKTPAPGDFRVQIEFGGRYEVVEPTHEQRRVALGAWDAGRARGEALYARVDLVEPAPDAPAIIELEMVEPELFFPMVDHAADRFTDAVLARLERQAHPGRSAPRG
ncbi:MAG: RimK family alpha-L-glutamate ligase [Phycisphaerales bacterium JB037]